MAPLTRSSTPTRRTDGSTGARGHPPASSAATVARTPTRPTEKNTPTRPTEKNTSPRESTGTLVVDRYRLQKPLGAGAFGTVWLAYDERLEREVAVKMLPRARVIGGRFEREARAAARLNHPGIVTLYEAAVDEDAAYLVSELVRGPTFGELLEEGRLSDRDIVAIGIALCDALEHAHRQGVVHRDVKPSNVLVPDRPSSPAALAKLTDFGVARVIGGNTLTRTGEIVGTAAYMAPEQAEGREAEAAADLYSLALVLYEALTGVNPVPVGPSGVRPRRLRAYLPPLRRYRRELPSELGRTIDRALRPRAGERGTLQDLRAGLVPALEEVADDPGVIDPPWRPLARPPAPLDPPWRPLSPPAVPVDPPWPPPRDANGAGLRGLDEATDKSGTDPPPETPRRASFRWPERALAGVGAAGIAAWLIASVFSTPPLAPSGVALVIGVTVAALPRLGWLALTLGAGIALAAAGRPGSALVVVAGLLLPTVFLIRRPTRWPLAVLAPALGALLLAGAWPALAGRAGRAWSRAVLGALGWIWVALAGLLTGRGVYTQLPPGIPAKAQWVGSVDQTITRAVWPLLHSGLLVPAIAWGVAAWLLPWVLRGTTPVRVVLITLWSAALASVTTSMLNALHTNVSPRPGAVVLGAVAGGVVALIPTLLGAWRDPSGSRDTAAGLA